MFSLFRLGSFPLTAFSLMRSFSGRIGQTFCDCRSARRDLIVFSRNITPAMAKPQEQKKASKKEKIAKVKASGFSEENVVNSDSESEQKKVQVKTPAKGAEKTKKTKSPTKKTAAPPPPPPPAKKAEKKAESSDDDDDDEDSDDDSDDLDGDDESTASEGQSGQAAESSKQSNGVKRKADEASSSDEEESGSDESLADVTQPAPKKAKTQQKAPSPSVESEEAAPLSSIPAGSFTAPKDFHPVDVAKLHSAFPSNVSGKQIWHITAPSALSISEINTVALDAIDNGKTVLTHKGSDYCLASDTSTNSKTFSVFLPGKEGYKKSETPVERSLHLQQKIDLPKLTSKQARTETGGEAAADVWKPVEEGPRPQPKGMRMRYKPPGFGLGEAGLGSDDEGESEGGFKLLRGKKSKKARRESGDAMEGVESTGKEMSKEERKKAKKEAKAKAGL